MMAAEAPSMWGLPLSDPSVLSRVLSDRTKFASETFQGDILQSVPLSRAQLKDTEISIALPPCKLGHETDLAGHPGFDKNKTIEYFIHFKLPDAGHRRLVELCWLVLREKFRNKDPKFVQHIDTAFSETGDDDTELAWQCFQSRARVPWRTSDNSFILKERTQKSNPIPLTVVSAEGVNHSGMMDVTPGSVVRLHVRIMAWSFNSMYGISVKLSDTGIQVYRREGRPIIRSSFLPGNFYMCVRPDESLEVRDACGHEMYVRFPCGGGTETFIIDETMAANIALMEQKLCCTTSCVYRTDDEQPYIKIPHMPATSGDMHTVLTPKIVANKSWRHLRWIIHEPPHYSQAIDQ